MRLFSKSICTHNKINGPNEGLMKPSPEKAMLFSPLGCTNPPPLSHLSAHTEPISQDTAGSDITLTV